MSRETGATPRLWMPGRRAVGWWLIVIALMIAGMVVVGGLTRLTGSGLSITQWRPVSGAIPPMNAHDWAVEFTHYKQIPQYQLENAGMTLEQFKGIFWWEWGHRLLGRLIGFVFLIPFLYFVWRGAIGRRDIPRMVLLFALGGLQGFIGWWMVESGLETRVSVSQYRLAIHLGVALILFVAILWTAFEYLRPKLSTATTSPLAKWAKGLAALVYVQMLLGALVAGLHAGLIYNTWPSMDGRVLPESPFFSAPWWINFFENAGLAQFDHRIGAYIVGLGALALWMAGRRAKISGMAQVSGNAVIAVTALQVALGITTLLLQAPVALSALHQFTALALLSVVLWHAYELAGASKGLVHAAASA